MNEIVRNILLGLSLAAPLGPSSVAVIQNGLKWGFRRAFLTGTGVTLADTTYLVVTPSTTLERIPESCLPLWGVGEL